MPSSCGWVRTAFGTLMGQKAQLRLLCSNLWTAISWLAVPVIDMINYTCVYIHAHAWSQFQDGTWTACEFRCWLPVWISGKHRPRGELPLGRWASSWLTQIWNKSAVSVITRAISVSMLSKPPFPRRMDWTAQVLIMAHVWNFLSLATRATWPLPRQSLLPLLTSIRQCRLCSV